MEMNDFDTGFLTSPRQVAYWLNFWGGRVGRVVSAVCFFVFILNNASALRAGKYLVQSYHFLIL